MGCNIAVRILKEFFSVESLDARIKPQQRKKVAKEISNSTVSTPQPSKWKTLEFKFYYIAFAIVVPTMFYAAMSATNESNESNYYKFEGLLSKGWIFGRKVDNSDAQYRFFRDNFVLLTSLMLGHVMIKRGILMITHVSKLRFDMIFGLFFLFIAHGFNSIRILIHMMVMFTIVHLFKRQRKLATCLTWTYGIATLFINDNFRNLPLGNLLPLLKPIDLLNFKGIIARWDVFFNFTLLRLISYNLDYLERWDNQFKTFKKKDTESSQDEDNLIQQQPSIRRMNSSETSLPTIQEDGNNYDTELLTNERARLVAPHHISEYNLSNFIAYVLYTPLFIAGPVVTFNDYVYQSKNTLPSINKIRLGKYALRLVLTILVMELLLHFTYVVAVSKTKAWEGDSPLQISMIGLFNLNIIYLKLLIPWRLFRLWGLLDGIDTPENMIRMVDNNYSALAFWRAWHRSYNKWVVRYIYIPLGGSKNRILTSLTVFSFVAIWHDIQLKLLFWGWLIVVFLIPEIMTTELIQPFRHEWWYRHVCALGAVINIWMMMIANLFGFCLGTDGTKALLWDMFSTSDGFLFFITASGCLFVAVQIMFELREEEKRNGIYLKC